MRRTLGIGLAMAACSLAFVAAGCGGSGSSGDDAGAAGASSEAISRDDGMLEMARCLREHGLDIDDPQAGQPMRMELDQDDPKAREAMETCRDELADVLPEPSAQDEERIREASLEFARCMRKNGVDMEDPQAGGDGLFRLGGDGLDPQSPTFEKAEKACESIMRDAIGDPGDQPEASS